MCITKAKILYEQAELEIIILCGTDVIATSVSTDEIEENVPDGTWQ